MIALTGGDGTYAEMVLARRLKKPVLALLAPGEKIAEQSSEELEAAFPVFGTLPGLATSLTMLL
jgi:hypothetical protein